MNPSNIIYSFVKGGLQNLTRQMAVLFGKANITINTVNAGGVIERKNSKIISPKKKFIKRYSKIHLLIEWLSQMKLQVL